MEYRSPVHESGRASLRKQVSPIHGYGIFATTDFHVGAVIYEIPTKLTSSEPHKNWARIGKNTWVDDETVLNYLNHSCNPNALLVTGEYPCLVAKRDILAGQEITCDYDLTENGLTEVECNCGDRACRKHFKITT
jgi:hypothetical protein